MTVRYGVIGCGGVSGKHYKPAQANPRLSVRAVCDLDEERARQVGKELSVEWYLDAREMIEQEDLELVSIATPPHTHRDIVDAVADTGVDMLVEKPFTFDLETAEEMIEMAEGKIAEVNNQLFQLQIREAKRRVDNGAVGTPGSAIVYKTPNEVKSEWSDDREWVENIPGGGIGEIMPHWIYNTRNLVGDIDTVESVNVEGSRDDFRELTAVLQNETCRTNLIITRKGVCSNFILVAGDAGSLMLNLGKRSSVDFSDPGSLLDVGIHDVKQTLDRFSQIAARGLSYGSAMAFRRAQTKPDRGFNYNGHYRLLSEMCDLPQDRMTVTPDDIRNNMAVYEDLLSGF